ncbi:hypothetical protein HYN49_08250 [Flavobacterium pallidum]|uniref:Uncharacterized protein n=2 Tax=Flavobacterium pallidum TaxID=2172098 RepID=A0A2S1SHN9_9FLAO|nr:hypothetical protein HYN49_08250 [Flavobacterium pallidum]
MKSLTLGKCVWDGGWFDTPSFTHANMPDYIYNTFVQGGIITIAQADEILNRMRAIPAEPAEFANINIEFTLEDALELKLSQQLDLNASFNLKNVKSFNFSGSVGKCFPNTDRLNIDKMLDEIKDGQWDQYKSGLRRAYIITELYYGKIEMSINSDMQAAFEGALPPEKLAASNKFTLGNTLSYIFESSDVPFAMRLERIKHFNS